MNQLVKTNSIRPHHLGGYTIFEIAIVMFILGLVIGVVVIGSDMIRSAELRAVTAERNNFEVAINTFETKYRQFPGDMPNAFGLWDTDCGNDSSAYNVGCNGDGDGYIRYKEGENIKAWEHLKFAEIIVGDYDGTGVPRFNDPDYPGDNLVLPSRQNSPASKLPTGLWLISDSVKNRAAGDTPDDSRYLALGNDVGTSYMFDNAGLRLTRAEAMSIDKKIDNGLANSGMVRGREKNRGTAPPLSDVATYGFRTGCNDDSHPLTDIYGVIGNSSGEDCTLFFFLDDNVD